MYLDLWTSFDNVGSIQYNENIEDSSSYVVE